ncbi:right-handed parallel beta-helix repeat-containing protein [Halorussus pelagicus]|uniref:right-handed parallel beta-helix repeat-containing protein n=1 Tax=Halorussus pelagicus TaxID=2505977 RepID=UPI00140AEECA|nr:right-handed parallel beta-helix repeat-containing protein [Halorussus pelagicus]
MTSRDVRRFGVLIAALVVAAGASVALAGATLPGASSTDAPSSTDATQRTIDSCGTIDRPGTYILSSEIENGGNTAISKPCIEITADDVTFNGNGHLIDGRGESHTNGIAVVGAEGVTIRNLAVDDWHAGIDVTEGSATIRNVETYSNTYGVRLENATGVTVENSTVTNNLVGVSAVSENVTLSNTDITENEIEIQREG